MTARTAMTYRDYAALPDDGKRYEIFDGALREMTGPTLLHQTVLFNLAKILDAHVTARNLGRVIIAPFDVILSDRPGETNILQPDIIYLDHERLGVLRAHAVEGPPTLVVEILSPRTAVIDRTTKRALYARYAVPYFWLIDLDARVIEAQALRAGEYAVAVAASGARPVDVPPFVDLGLVPASLWP
jgi:Uma2 family endonuclease